MSMRRNGGSSGLPPCVDSECEVFQYCKCVVEKSRFSIRVMEAMRLLRENDDLLPTCTSEEIIDYIEEHYRNDGDVNAQVRTALKQVCDQGFVRELLENEYQLVGPNATNVNIHNSTQLRDNSSCSCITGEPGASHCNRSRRKRESRRPSSTRKRKSCASRASNRSNTSRSRAARMNKDNDNDDCDVHCDDDADNLETEEEDEPGDGCRDAPHCSKANHQASEGKKSRSVDSFYNRIINNANGRSGNRKRERELKSWIRQCRRECEKQVHDRKRQDNR